MCFILGDHLDLTEANLNVLVVYFIDFKHGEGSIPNRIVIICVKDDGANCYNVNKMNSVLIIVEDFSFYTSPEEFSSINT